MQERRKGRYTPEWKSYFQAGLWIRENTSPDIVTSTRNPFLFYIFSEREGISIPLQGPEKIWEEFKNKKVNYIIVPPSLSETKKSQDIVENFLNPFLERYKNRLEKVATIGTLPTCIYHLKRETSPY